MKVKNEDILINYLINNTDYSNKKIKSLLKYGSILVNDKIVTKHDYLLKLNDEIIINNHNKSSIIKIIYEDNNIIVVDKPNNILSVSDESDSITMYNLVSDYVKTKNKNNKIFIVHRLDKETSGVLMFAKNEKVKKLYQDNWNDLVLKREYVAIVLGKTKNSGTIKSYLNENKNHFVFSSKTGKLAITHYKKIKENNNYTYLSINLETGRKNQIRVHMKELGNPILGDMKYGNTKAKRLFLHAHKLVIVDPITKKENIFTSSIPEEFDI